MAEFILKLPRVKARTGLSRSSIYAGIKSGSFPAPVALGIRAVGWLDSDITGWIEQRVTTGRDGHAYGRTPQGGSK
jgi:prophage regulatory protein